MINNTGHDYLADYLNGALTTYESNSVTSLFANAFRDYTPLVSISCPNAEKIGSECFRGCSNLVEAVLPKVKAIKTGAFRNAYALQSFDCRDVTEIGPNAFEGTTSLQKVVNFESDTYGTQSFMGSGIIYAVFAKQASIYQNSQYSVFQNCTNLIAADLRRGQMAGRFFSGSAISTLVLRRSTSVTWIANINVFENTPFDNGGSGGTIYIPKALYDHLGDGSNLDYKASANWSTIDGYGTITWAQIEGSYYETHYADGTPI